MEEDAERPEQRAVEDGTPLMWDFGVKDQGAFSPLRPLVCEAVTAIPATGGAVTALLTVRVGIVVAAILDVSWAVKQDDVYKIRSFVSMYAVM